MICRDNIVFSDPIIRHVMLLYPDHADVVPGSIAEVLEKATIDPVTVSLWENNLSLVPCGDKQSFACMPFLFFRFKNNRLYDLDEEIVIVSIQVNTKGIFPLLSSDTIEFTGIRLDPVAGKKSPARAVYTLESSAATKLTSCLTAIGRQYVLT
jgi:hypothetical protein